MPSSNVHYFGGDKFNRNHPTIVMIHGAGQTSKTWEYQLPVMREDPDFNCVILDLPGHGKSAGTGCSSINEYKRFLKSFCDEMDFTNLILVGHSMGGGIAQLYCIDYPQTVSMLVLAATGARLRVAEETLNLVKTDYNRFCEIAPSRAFAPSSPDTLKDEFRMGLLGTPPQTVLQDLIACDQFDSMDRIGEILAPTLIIAGDQDMLTPVKYGEYLNNKIEGSTLRVIDDSGHFIMKEKPNEFNEVIMNFLKSQ